MRRLNIFKFLFVLLFSLVFLMVPNFAQDDIEGLIDIQKGPVATQEDKEELPVVYLAGDASGVELYSPGLEIDSVNTLCSPIELDELRELSQASPEDNVVILNLSLLPVREEIEKACIVRPGDIFMAVGPGWQSALQVKDFLIKKAPAPCPNDNPLSLWVNFQEDVPEAPLFYSTDLNLRPQENAYLTLRAWKSLPTAPFFSDLKSSVQNVRDYDLKIFEVSAPNCNFLYSFKRKKVSRDDQSLPNEMLAFRTGKEFEVLWLEKVDEKNGSGHIDFIGSIDFDNNGYIDFLAEGSHKGCPYQVLFMGTEVGFTPVPFPRRRCFC